MNKCGHELHVGKRPAAARVVVEGAPAREALQQQFQIVDRARVADITVPCAFLVQNNTLLQGCGIIVLKNKSQQKNRTSQMEATIKNK